MSLKSTILSASVLIALLPLGAAHAEVFGQWSFNEYPVGEDTIGSDFLVLDESGSDRHMAAAFGLRDTVEGPGGTTAAEIDGGKFFQFMPGFNQFVDANGPLNPVVTAGSDFTLTGDFTIEVIATLPQNTFNNFNEGFLVGRGRYSSTDQYGISVYNDGGSQPNTVGAFIADAGNGVFSNIDQRNSPPPAGWHHIAMVRDRVNDIHRLYINGVVAVENLSTPGGLDVDDTGTHNLFIGGDFFNTSLGRINKPYQGTIDFVKISSGALDPSEFTMVDIPEPTSLALLGLGGIFLVRRRSR